MKKDKNDKNAILDHMDFPNISIIIITKGRRESMKSAVKSILECDYPLKKIELIVLEETNSPEPLRLPNIIYHSIPEKNLGFAYARNEGMKFASNQIVVFIDDDCLAHREWLKEIVTPLINDSNVAAVGGAVLVPLCGIVGKCENILGFPGGGVKYINNADGRIIARSTFSTCNCAIRKDVIDDAGGFDETLRTGGEDEMLSRKINENGTILFNPRARVFHTPRDAIFGVFKWFVRRGRARIKTLRLSADRKKYFKIVVNSQIIRVVILVSIGLLMNLPILPIISAFMLFYYMVVLWRFRWARKYYPAVKTLLFVPIVKLIMDIGMDIGILSGLFLSLRKGNKC